MTWHAVKEGMEEWNRKGENRNDKKVEKRKVRKETTRRDDYS